jgi:uncharacterized protein (DUF488 family)
MRRIFTVGHSTRTLEELVEMLKAHGVGAVADVRRYPGSRKMPWFAAENLASSLPKSGLEYWPFVELGGRRKALANSINTGWRNEAFRGYADYMQTPEFVKALDRLLAKAKARPTAVMCAEAVPWRCHRSLIADAMLVRGSQVMDIYDSNKATAHQLTSFARVEGTRIIYPAEATEMPLFKK